jgi:2-dehydro-3-deoxyphosphogluconate aldolase/(4S)-4-hydroxy-2-oxoglutarate aldolase
MHEVLQQIAGFGLIPIVTISNQDVVRPLARAFLTAGLPVIEITFRTNEAENAIKIIRKEFPGMLVGAGTVLTVGQAEKAQEAGAQFILTPGFNPNVVDYCMDTGIPIIPGINSPTHMDQACAKGLEVLKFFPAEVSGGVALLRSMAAPFTNVWFIPTGGINNTNLSSYFSYERVLACGGSWIARNTHITSGRFEEITKTVREAITIMLGCGIAMIRLNEKSRGEIKIAGELFKALFPIKEMGEATLLGDLLCITKKMERDIVGEIIIATRNIRRTAFYLKSRNVAFTQIDDPTEEVKPPTLTFQKKIAGLKVTFIEKPMIEKPI